MTQKVFIVTGSGKGIGFQVVQDLIIKKQIVVACTKSSSSNLDKLKQSLKEEEIKNFLILKFDLNDYDQSKEVVQKIWKIYTKIDVLINCAGISHGSLFNMTKISDMEKVFNTNFFSLIQFSQLCSRYMMRRKTGAICNISSITSFRSDEGTLVYGASKSALNYSTKIIAKELGAYGIRVNAVAPGVTKTDMLNLMDKSAIQKQVEESSLKKIADPKEISSVILFLCSEEAKHITGEIIKVDGGQL